MSRVPLPTTLLAASALLLVLAGCGRGGDAASTAGGRGALPLRGDGMVEWQGVSPCADCDAIEVRLRIAQEGKVATYRLDERFVAADGGAVFTEEGGWRLRDGVLDLEGSRGARRHFAVLDGGRLRPGDAAGAPAPGREDDLLVPVAAEDF